MTLRLALLAATILATASLALPWQIDGERVAAGHGVEIPARHAGMLQSDMPDGEPEGGSHDHGAECFWCVAMLGTLAPRVDVVERPIEVPAPDVFVVSVGGERPTTHDAAPRAPPAPHLC